MTNHNAEATATKVLDALLAAEPYQKLAIFAVFAAGGATFEYFDPDAYSNGEKKRAIKLLRLVQKDSPDKAEPFERAITFIRNNWLRKAA